MSQHRKYILHSRHIWTGVPAEETLALWSLNDETTRGNSFLVEDIRECLILKLEGFVRDQKAKVCDVSENHLSLQLGGSWLSSLFSEESCPLDLEIRFRPAEATHNPQAEVEVVIRDRRMFRQPNRFEIAARRVMWHLKKHLMANQ